MAESPLSGGIDQMIAYWRWPFVALIAGLAMYALWESTIRRGVLLQHAHASPSDSEASPTVVALDSHVVEGSRG